MEKRRVFVVGNGMTKFTKPHTVKEDYFDLARSAINDALKDANISFNEVEQACVGYVFGDSTKGQRAVYEVGKTGIPVYNVNNNCSTGSTALYMAKQFIEGGINHCVLALGFEKMESGSLDGDVRNPSNPIYKHFKVMTDIHGDNLQVPQNPQMFGNAAREHIKLYGSTPEHYAKIAYKNHLHSVNNERAQFQKHYTLEEVKKSRTIYDPLTLLMCSPTSDGAAAAIVCSLEFVKKHGLEKQAVEIIGMSLASDLPSTFESNCIKMLGFDIAQKAAREVYRQSGLGPEDVQVIELHDCFASNELLTYESLGLCPVGKGHEIVDRNDNTYGGKWVINPSGGLISKGHPLGATGLAQCAELCWQVRGIAGKRQVKGAKVGLQHNLGIGSAVVIAMYRLGFPEHHSNSISMNKVSGSCPFSHKSSNSHCTRIQNITQHLTINNTSSNDPSPVEIGDLEAIKGKMTGVKRFKKDNTWIVTGFKSGKALFDNTTKITSSRSIFIPETEEQKKRYQSTIDFFDSWILVHDPPRHTKYRSLLFKFLTTKKVSALDNIIQEAADKLIDLVKDKGKMDLRHDFSSVLPVVVTATLLGAPLTDIERLKHYAHVFADVVGKKMTVEQRLAMSEPVVKESMEYVKGLFDKYRNSPKVDNLINDIIADVEERRSKGMEVDDYDVYANVVLLIFASADTLTLAIPNIIINLLNFPEDKEYLMKNWDQVHERALEELLRHSGPGGITARFATGDIHVRDNEYIRAGDTILLDVHHINRDPTAFERPDVIDLRRKDLQHLSFGSGRHMCIGRNLARAELKVAIKTLLTRLPNIRLSIKYSELVRDASLTVTGWESCPVVF